MPRYKIILAFCFIIYVMNIHQALSLDELCFCGNKIKPYISYGKPWTDDNFTVIYVKLLDNELIVEFESPVFFYNKISIDIKSHRIIPVIGALDIIKQDPNLGIQINYSCSNFNKCNYGFSASTTEFVVDKSMKIDKLTLNHMHYCIYNDKANLFFRIKNDFYSQRTIIQYYLNNQEYFILPKPTQLVLPLNDYLCSSRKEDVILYQINKFLLFS